MSLSAADLQLIDPRQYAVTLEISQLFAGPTSEFVIFFQTMHIAHETPAQTAGRDFRGEIPLVHF
ncbi:MAG: hypothetical protein C5B49_15020 [Bdellovibrio sp.]|nr:MAG: hypothetical protein C5B49_15020 [Bdellovibrio sp.]